jgi:hypothetical protein
MALYGSFFHAIGGQPAKSPANRKRGPLMKGTLQTLLANKKQGKVDQVHAAKIIEPALFRINRKKYICSDGKSEKPLKNLKTSRDPFRF